jgi:hypothetical protein
MSDRRHFKMNLSSAFTLHTPNALNDIIANAQTESKMEVQLVINTLQGFLLKIADRAIELNDDELNALCCRMTLFSQADPTSPDYDREGVEALYKRVGYDPLGVRK